MLGAVVDEVLFTIFAKVTSSRTTPLATSTAASVFALLMFAPLSAYEAWNFDFSAVSLVDWVPIAYYGVFVTVVVLLWLQGVSKVLTSTAAVFTSVLPVSAVLLSCVLLGEPVRLTHLVGIFLISRAPEPT